jgi:chromosome segregation protein
VYLKGLRLKGFKSFPGQTSLVFEPGVGVIIGPNGSGKSNLADAVIWALGEQSPTSLRGTSMQDLIFAGSDGRRALASAEVELTFDNTDGSLPLPTAEVSVMRRVTRDGSSQYFINRSACRLTDVVELLAPVGLGKELHSIIGQGKVEAFLAGKPEDRRSQIEEAAGLGAFKRRRERAEIKLREVGRNLERAALLERQVDAQLGPIRRQATAAEQLRSIEADIGETRGRLLTGAVVALDAELLVLRQDLAEIAVARTRGDEGLARVAEARAGEEEAFARRLAERERRAQRLLRARMLDTRLDTGERLTEQRLRLITEMERAAEAERQRLLHELTGQAEEPQQDSWRSLERDLEEELAEAVAAHAAATGRLEASRETLAARRAALARLSLEHETALATGARLERREQGLAGEEARLLAQHRRLEDDRQETARAEETAVAADVSAREKLRAAATIAAHAAAAEAAAAKTAGDLDEVQRAALREVSGGEADLALLRAALRDLQDVDAQALKVAEGYPGTASLAATVSCAPGYERALGAALSQATGALAVPRDVDHWSLLSALRRAGVGLVRLAVASSGARPTPSFPGAVPLLDKVDLRGRAQLEGLLGDVVLVDDLRAVPEGFPGLAVTSEGDFYRPLAGQIGLSGGVTATLLLERRASAVRLEDELIAIRSRAARAAADLETARRQADATRETSAAAAASERAARLAAESAERELAALRARRRDVEANRARDQRSLEGIAAELAETRAGLEAAVEAAALALSQSDLLRPDHDVAEADVRGVEEAWAASQALVTRRRVELEEQRAAALRTAERMAAARTRAAAMRSRLEELERRLADLPRVRALCAALASRIAAVRAHSRRVVADLEPQAQTETHLDRGELRALAEREAALRRDLAETNERRTAVQIQVTRLEDRRVDLVATLAEVSEQLDRAGFAAPADAAEVAALSERLERFTRRRGQIGPVNPLAAAECADLEERAAFFREQRRDLERSVADLGQLIRDLTAQVDAEFAQTFVAVRDQFTHMVSVLFPGGRGSLELVEPAEAHGPGGVSVQVKPAKKLGQRLQLLSGGERALVAIAFLMALVLARPSPLYVLDEIEAALDDVNIGRLVQLLRDYRTRTQFLVITHQKRTMDAADVLYGVTMGPDGASRVVSARMAEAAIEREARSQGGTTAVSSAVETAQKEN